MDKLTTTDLVGLLSSMLKPKDSDIDKSQYRYVIYARKSSESEEKQVRSLGDQNSECEDLANRLGLNIVDTINEAESAKEPDIRPKFRAMVEGFKQGKYEGIIAWHPDRLARNMKDAGELIDLLDKQIIKDLKFVSFTFENNTTGKMLLGISFVLSKQYSDQLSDNVLRGNKRSVEEGKYINKGKHGYYKDRNQFLRPDGNNFVLIKNAFQMRKQGATLQAIVEYLNNNKYSVKRGKDDQHKVYKIDIKRVADFLKDPSYTGVLLHGSNIVDLTAVYNFVPAVSVDDFMEINKTAPFSRAFKLARKQYKPESIKADLMRGMVICEGCGEPMAAGLTSKKTNEGKRQYFYYRCETSECPFQNKSVRAKVIIDAACEYLDKHDFTSRRAYDHYVQEMNVVFKQREAILRKEYDIMTATQRQDGIKLNKIKEFLLNETDSEIKDNFKKDLAKKEVDIKQRSIKLNKMKLALQHQKDAILDYPVFLELFKKLPENIRQTKNMADLDLLMKKIFTNFVVRAGKPPKITQITLNQPFDRLANVVDFSNGGDGGARTRNLSRDRRVL
jgi:DNA invertase Pin-like site-specific DNA recombinase